MRGWRRVLMALGERIRDLRDKRRDNTFWDFGWADAGQVTGPRLLTYGEGSRESRRMGAV